MRALFGDFELDLKSLELSKGGTPVPLQDQPARILALLVQNAGRIVTRSDIHQHLWQPGVHLDFDHSVNKSISKLRSVLEDVAETPRFVETVPRRGYRFVAPVELSRRLANHVHTLYLQGRYLLNRRTGASMQAALQVFQDLIALDPNCAPGYAMLAKTYLLLSNRGHMSPTQALHAARDAAARTISLDEQVAEAHAVLGWVALTLDHDWESGEAKMRDALRKVPASNLAHHLLGLTLVSTGRFDEALKLLRSGLEADPFSAPAHAVLVWALNCARRPEEAIEQGKQAVSLNHDYANAWGWLSFAYTALGNFEQAIAAAENSIRYCDNSGLMQAAAAYVYAAAGHRQQSESLLAEVESKCGKHCVPFPIAAPAWAHLGRMDRALEWLERAYSEHSDHLVSIAVDPRCDILRQQVQFNDLVRRLHAPACPPA